MKRAVPLCLLLVCRSAFAGKDPTSIYESETAKRAGYTLTKLDIDLLDDVSRRAARYFLEQTDVSTGLVLDRAYIDGKIEESGDHMHAASIAATGFGLSAFCIAADHRWISRETARSRIVATLRFFAYDAPQEHGWFYHFLDWNTGKRVWQSEVSSIDTALLMGGVLTAREYFKDDPEIVYLASLIYDRVDFPWMMDGSTTYFSHGWTPEKGFIRYRWDTYSELLILYTLGIGSRTHAISPDTWDTWKLPVQSEGDRLFVGGGPLFIHQYSQAWLDLRKTNSETSSSDVINLNINSPLRRYSDFRLDYYANSVAATRAQQQAFRTTLAQKFPGYSDNLWGITASDSAKGYTAWGSSATNPQTDGTLVPSAAAGSLMFAPDICIPAVREMLVKYGAQIYGRYGFADAFNPSNGWVSKYVLGIDVGITLLSAENLRTGKVWGWFMGNPEPRYALAQVGLASPPNPLEIHVDTGQGSSVYRSARRVNHDN